MLGDVEVLDAEELLGLGDAGLGGRDGLVLLVVLVVVLGLGGVARLAQRLQLGLGLFPDHLLGEAGEGVVGVGGLLGLAGDDQRRPRLVDQDVVDLVDDRELVRGLDRRLQRGGHVVAQVVEAELGVGPVGDARAVGLAALLGRHLGLDHADRHAQRVVERGHPLGVATGQVVVDRDQVDGVARERVEEDGEGRGERLALSRLHLRDRAVVEHHAADHLDVEMALAEGALPGLTHQREGLGQQVVERLVVLAGTPSELVGALAQLRVLEQLHLGLEAVDHVHPLLEVLELLALPDAEGAVDQSSACHHRSG